LKTAYAALQTSDTFFRSPKIFSANRSFLPGKFSELNGQIDAFYPLYTKVVNHRNLLGGFNFLRTGERQIQNRSTFKCDNINIRI